MSLTPPLDWSSDANFPAGSEDWSGEPTKLAPSSGRVAAGLRPNETLPANWLNYILNHASGRISVLQTAFNALATSLGVSLSDGNLDDLLTDHMMARPATSTDDAIATFDGTNAKRLQNTAAKVVGNDLVLPAAGAYKYASAKTITRYLRSEALIGYQAGALNWVRSTTEFARGITNSGVGLAIIPAPPGSVITQVRVNITTGAARGTVGNRVQLQMYRQIPNAYTGPLANPLSLTADGSAQNDDGTQSTQLFTFTPNYTVIDAESYGLRVQAGNTAGSSYDTINWIEYTFTTTEIAP